MNAATHKVEGNAKVPVLYMALELREKPPLRPGRERVGVRVEHPPMQLFTGVRHFYGYR